MRKTTRRRHVYKARDPEGKNLRPMFKFFLPALVLFLGLLPRPGFTWGADGHKIICEIAYKELNPIARIRVNQLLAADPEYHSFAAACVWADQVANSTRPETKPWHFLNLPRSARRVSLDDCPRREGCILSAIARHSAALADPKTPPAEKLEALKYLGHWIGDFHQPLHLSFLDDRGGNFIPVRWMYFRDTDLHRLWDSEMIADEEHAAHMRWKTLAARLDADVTPGERRAWTQGSILDWANETFKITRAAQTGYVTARPNQLLELNNAYYRANLPVVNGQLERAGIRLGAILNKILGRQTY